jgi:hypothetical protein
MERLLTRTVTGAVGCSGLVTSFIVSLLQLAASSAVTAKNTYFFILKLIKLKIITMAIIRIAVTN